MRPRHRILLVALVLTTLTALWTTSGVAASVVVSSAQYSQSVASSAERRMFGPELIGKVTKAGKVGNIDAKIGDLVLREVQVPGGRGARTALGPATVQASTVLHGQHIRDSQSSADHCYRMVVAVQENQSKQVRAYAKGHLFNCNAGTLIATFHQLQDLTIENWDYDSLGDGCGPYGGTGGTPCAYSKNPANCDSGTKCLDYYALGTYRHKCGQEGWGCNNDWVTLTSNWKWWEPVQAGYLAATFTCSYYWNVLHGSGGLGCTDA